MLDACTLAEGCDHHRVVEAVLVRMHELACGVSVHDLDERIGRLDAHESGEASDRTSPVARSRLVSHQERIRLIAPGPPAQKMREVVAAARSAGHPERHELLEREGAGRHHPALEEALDGHVGILGFAQRHHVAHALRQTLVLPVRLEATRRCALRSRHIRVGHARGVIPRGHAADVVEIHIACARGGNHPDLMKHLLHKRRATLGPARDEHVAGLGRIRRVVHKRPRRRGSHVDAHLFRAARQPPQSASHAIAPRLDRCHAPTVRHASLERKTQQTEATCKRRSRRTAATGLLARGAQATVGRAQRVLI